MQLLLIEDDTKLAELVARFLRESDFDVLVANNSTQAQRLITQTPFDLIICDLMLPDDHGFHLAERLRRDSRAPIIFLTAIGDDETHIEGLERGGADYIVKPVDPALLVARVRAHLRKHESLADDKRSLDLDALYLDAGNRSVKIAGAYIDISRHEFNLLWQLASHVDTTLTREYLFEQSVERDYDGQDRTIDGRVSRLRKKLDGIDGNPWTIKTIWGRGYLFCKRDEAL